MKLFLSLFVFVISLNSFADEAHQNMKDQLSKEDYEAMMRKET